MTIRKGENWGSAVEPPPGLTVLRDGAELGRYVTERRRQGTNLDHVGIAAGDLARTMGGGTPGRFNGVVVKGLIEIVGVEADGKVAWAASHVVGRRLTSRLRGEVLFVMNAQFLGPYDIAPRGHPNDGRVEVLKVASSMSWRVRRRALQRALTGTHVPHPLISTAVVSTSPHEVVFERPLDLWLDGTKWLRTRSATFTVEADALEVFA